jgi:ribosome biogenesis GTPase / thiamine phosphate phosphatase
MIETDFERLRSMGLTPALAHQAIATEESLGTGAGAFQLMRLTEVHRETVVLHDGDAEQPARALPRLLRQLADDESALAVGDWVLMQCDVHGQRWLHARVPPQSHIVRRDADGRRHPVVSNVDTALLVMGLDDDFNPRRMERFFALVQGSGVTPVIVLSKADAVDEARSLFERVQTVRSRMPAGVDVLSVDARDPETALRLTPFTRAGQTLVLLGSSGAGKSTLTNTLIGHAVQDTGAVREHDSRGKHTTTSRSLHRLPGGACVIDTPGLRTLRPDMDERTVAATFGDIEALSMQCRFRDCKHHDEPGCAVRDGIGGDRLRNYHKLLREARRDTMSALERQQQLAMWKARGREGRTRLKMKRGEE